MTLCIGSLASPKVYLFTMLFIATGCGGSSLFRDASAEGHPDPYPLNAALTTAGIPQKMSRPQESDDGVKAVVCRDANQKITSAELLDFYEADSLQGWKIAKSNEPTIEQFKKVAKKLNAGGMTRWESSQVQFYSDRLRILDDQAALAPAQDISPVVVRRNCAVEQAASVLNREKILVDGTIWKAFTETDKAGLMMHAAIEDSERLSGRTPHSDYTRKVNAFLFTDQNLEPFDNGISGRSYDCRAEGQTRGHQYEFSAHETNGQWQLQFYVIDGSSTFSQTSLSLKYFKFPVDSNYSGWSESEQNLVSKLWSPKRVFISMVNLYTKTTPGGNRGYLEMPSENGKETDVVFFECK